MAIPAGMGVIGLLDDHTVMQEVDRIRDKELRDKMLADESMLKPIGAVVLAQHFIEGKMKQHMAIQFQGDTAMTLAYNAKTKGIISDEVLKTFQRNLSIRNNIAHKSLAKLRSTEGLLTLSTYLQNASAVFANIVPMPERGAVEPSASPLLSERKLTKACTSASPLLSQQELTETCTVLLEYLPDYFSKQNLQELLSGLEDPPLAPLQVIQDHVNTVLRAFLTFRSAEAAAAAVERLHNLDVIATPEGLITGQAVAELEGRERRSVPIKVYIDNRDPIMWAGNCTGENCPQYCPTTILAKKLRGDYDLAKVAHIFGQCGYVTECRMVMDPTDTNEEQRKAWLHRAYITYSRCQDAKLAMRRLDRTYLFAKPNEKGVSHCQMQLEFKGLTGPNGYSACSADSNSSYSNSPPHRRNVGGTACTPPPVPSLHPRGPTPHNPQHPRPHDSVRGRWADRGRGRGGRSGRADGRGGRSAGSRNGQQYSPMP